MDRPENNLEHDQSLLRPRSGINHGRLPFKDELAGQGYARRCVGIVVGEIGTLVTMLFMA